MLYLKVFGVWLKCFCGILFQEPYSKVWDIKLNELMDKNLFIKAGDHTVTIGEYKIWISNKWYSYAHPWGCGKPAVRPSIKTMIRFSEYVEKKSFE